MTDRQQHLTGQFLGHIAITETYEVNGHIDGKCTASESDYYTVLREKIIADGKAGAVDYCYTLGDLKAHTIFHTEAETVQKITANWNDSKAVKAVLCIAFHWNR